MDNTPEYVNSKGLPDIPPPELGDSQEIMRKTNTELSKPRNCGSETGRKSEYFTKVQPYLGAILAWSRDGESQKEIIKRLGIAEKVFYNYCKRYPELAQILKFGKEHYLARLENALDDSATGETLKEEKYKTIFIKNPNAENGLGERIECIQVETTFKQVPKNVVAIMAQLRNRWPKKWNVADKVQIEGKLSFGNLLSEVRENEAKKRAEQLGLDPQKEVQQVEG
jgi:hypothetical protein